MTIWRPAVGTRSVLFGAHQFLLHPWFVAWGWWTLFGFPWDPRLWVAFFVHDLGYLGKPNMDGPEGESHPILGGRIMARLFGLKWYAFSVYHSRFLAGQHGVPLSPLCYADKMAIVLTPWWIYLPLTRLTGEGDEYRERARPGGKYATMHIWHADERAYYESVQEYLRQWLGERFGDGVCN